MFEKLNEINTRPKPFEFYTAADLWTDEYTSAQMLAYHLDEEVDMSSRNGKFIDGSVEWIVSHFNVGAGTRVADFGCGPGLYTLRLARRQADVTGIDFSPRSIRYAREAAGKEGLPVNYINQNYLDYESEERFHLILMIMCDFCAIGPDRRKQMLATFHKHLEPGGAVLLDVYTLPGFEQREESATYAIGLLNGFWSSHRYYGFLNVFKYPEEKVVLDKYTIIEESRTRVVYNWLQYFSPGSLKQEFLDTGFAVEAIYSDVAGTPFQPESTEMAIVARKK